MPQKGLVAHALEYDSKLRAILYRATGNVSDVEELLQETYEHLLRVEAKERAAIRSVPAFVATVAINVARDWRDRKNLVPIDLIPDMAVLNLIDPMKSAAEQIDDLKRSERLAAAISRLPPRCREVIELRKMHGRSAKEISRQLEISPHTVREYLKKGVRLLRGWMTSETAEKEASS